MGIVAAIFTASNPLFVMHAHRVRSDHILTCFLLLGTLFIIELQKDCEPREIIKIAINSGLAFTYKYFTLCLPISTVKKFL